MLKANNEYLIDGATYKVTRTISANAHEIVMVRNQKETMQHMLTRATAANFSTERQRIKTAANWCKQLLKKGSDKHDNI